MIHTPSRCLLDEASAARRPSPQARPTLWAVYTPTHTVVLHHTSPASQWAYRTPPPNRSATSPAVDQTKLPGGPVALGAHFCAAIGWKAAVPWEACSVKAPYSVIEEGRRKTAICRLQLLLCAAHCWVHTLLSWHSSDFLYTVWVRASLAAAPLSLKPPSAPSIHHGSASFTHSDLSFADSGFPTDDNYRPDDRVSTVCFPSPIRLHLP